MFSGSSEDLIGPTWMIYLRKLTPTPTRRLNTNAFGHNIKHQKSSNIGVAPLKVDGRLVTDPKEQANVLNHQFRMAFSEGKSYSGEEFTDKCKMPHTL